jgi:hypothetical protein
LDLASTSVDLLNPRPTVMGVNYKGLKEFRDSGDSITIPEMILGLQNWGDKEWSSERKRIREMGSQAFFTELLNKFRTYSPDTELVAQLLSVMAAEARKNFEAMLTLHLRKSIKKATRGNFEVRFEMNMSFYAYMNTIFYIGSRVGVVRK